MPKQQQTPRSRKRNKFNKYNRYKKINPYRYKRFNKRYNKRGSGIKTILDNNKISYLKYKTYFNEGYDITGGRFYNYGRIRGKRSIQDHCLFAIDEFYDDLTIDNNDTNIFSHSVKLYDTDKNLSMGNWNLNIEIYANKIDDNIENNYITDVTQFMNDILNYIETNVVISDDDNINMDIVSNYINDNNIDISLKNSFNFIFSMYKSNNTSDTNTVKDFKDYIVDNIDSLGKQLEHIKKMNENNVLDVCCDIFLIFTNDDTDINQNLGATNNEYLYNPSENVILSTTVLLKKNYQLNENEKSRYESNQLNLSSSKVYNIKDNGKVWLLISTRKRKCQYRVCGQINFDIIE